VELNGRDLGVYVLEEGFTEDFLACHFKRLGGDLYEPEDGQDIDRRLKRNSVQAPVEGRGALEALAGAAAEPDLAWRWQRLEQVLDTERFVASMALETLICHRDGYCLARNNFRVYHDLDSGKMVFFPHGMDQLLGKEDFPWQPQMAGLVARCVMETQEGRQRYAAAFNSLFTNLFQPQDLARRVDQLVLELGPFLDGNQLAGIKTEAALVKERITKRYLNLKSQLSQPAPNWLAFENGVALLEGWVKTDASASGHADRTPGPAGVAALRLSASSETLAYWTTQALLKPGRYRFQGKARVSGVKPLPYGIHQGAGIRVGGRVRKMDNLIGDSSWREVETEFQVERDGEAVEFICELRASAGEAWFDLDTLKIVRLFP